MAASKYSERAAASGSRAIPRELLLPHERPPTSAPTTLKEYLRNRARIKQPAPTRIIDDVPIILGSELGAGAFARVHRALNILTGQEIAVKISKTPIGHQRKKREAVDNELFDEYQIMWRLRHPHILRCDGSSFLYPTGEGQIDGCNWIILEFAAGSLADFIASVKRRGSKVSLADFWGIVHDLFSALTYLSDNPYFPAVIHCDLKPENCLISPSGLIKVADFGLARSVDMPFSSEQLVGTLTYTAPEFFDGVLTPAYDVFSIGVILAQLRLGRHPLTELCPEIATHRSDKHGYAFLRKFYGEYHGDLSCQGSKARLLHGEQADIVNEVEPLISCLMERDPFARPRPSDVVEYSRSQLTEKDRQKLKRRYLDPLEQGESQRLCLSEKPTRESSRPASHLENEQAEKAEKDEEKYIGQKIAEILLLLPEYECGEYAGISSDEKKQKVMEWMWILKDLKMRIKLGIAHHNRSSHLPKKTADSLLLTITKTMEFCTVLLSAEKASSLCSAEQAATSSLSGGLSRGE